MSVFTTQQAIRNSCIKLLNECPSNHQITVKDIVEDCGINRNSFYYHYHDLPSLVEEIFTDEADALIRDFPRIDTIEEGLKTAVSFALENKKMILHLYNSKNREMYEHYLWRICHHIAEAYINTAFSEYAISESDKNTIIHFHQCECFGIIMNWVSSGMKSDILENIHRLCEIRKGMTKEMFQRCEEVFLDKNE